MAHTYASEYPSGIKIDSGIKTFFEKFYQISDTGTEEAHLKYADQFTKDATLVMASTVGKGRDGTFPYSRHPLTCVRLGYEGGKGDLDDEAEV